jgi:glycine/D-amino acid oxidase-like deaminating enzyme
MKTQARVVVIGGGVVGCSALYHLAKAGWTDAMLIERSELTSGSSWHAAGGFHTLNGDPNVAKLQAYTVSLYREIEELSGQSCGLHLTGGMMMAGDAARMDFLRLTHAKGRCLGMETEIITPSESAAMFPLMDPKRGRGPAWLWRAAIRQDGRRDAAARRAARRRQAGGRLGHFGRLRPLRAAVAGAGLPGCRTGGGSRGRRVRGGDPRMPQICPDHANAALRSGRRADAGMSLTGALTRA